MSEFEDKLSAVLGDREAMSQIMALAQSLSNKEGGAADTARENAALSEERPPSPEASGELSALLGRLDPKTVQMGMRLLEEYNRSDDRNAALLAALRPFVKEERFAKVDRAVRIARLSRVARVVLESLKERGGGFHV